MPRTDLMTPELPPGARYKTHVVLPAGTKADQKSLVAIGGAEDKFKVLSQSQKPVGDGVFYEVEVENVSDETLRYRAEFNYA